MSRLSISSDTTINNPRIVAAMPLAAMFILFELLVHDDPTCTDIKHNLFSLDKAVGYFSRLDYDSGCSFRGSMFSEFILFARLFVYKEQNTHRSVNPNITAGSNNPDHLHYTPLGINGTSSQVSPIFVSIIQYMVAIGTNSGNSNRWRICIH